MSSYIPGAGFKKPSNSLENPIMPDIKKAPPRFRWSRKHWVVDPSVMLDHSSINIHQHVGDAVLFQSRDYATTQYGRSSHRDYINEHFRPPVQTRDDSLPLSRIPRKTVFGKVVNPMMEHLQFENVHQDVGAKLTNRTKNPYIRPTVGFDTGGPVEHFSVPDKYIQRGKVYSAKASIDPAFKETIRGPVDEEKFITSKVTAISHSGQEFTALATMLDSPMTFEHMITDKKQTPLYTAEAETTYQDYGNKDPVNIHLEHKLPTAEALSRVNIGMSSQVTMDPIVKGYESHDVKLYIRPQSVFQREEKMFLEPKVKKIALRASSRTPVNGIITPHRATDKSHVLGLISSKKK